MVIKRCIFLVVLFSAVQVKVENHNKFFATSKNEFYLVMITTGKNESII